MDAEVRVRVGDPGRDAERVAEIYRPAVETSHISFEEVAPDAAEMARRMRDVLAWTAWLVAEADGAGVVGYAYASRHRERAAYRWSVDISVYVDLAWHGRGVGRRLYDELLAILRGQGFVNAYAGVTLPNPASVALHEAIGMRLIGVYERVGFKNGAWHDVAWYGMLLVEPKDQPPEPAHWAALDAGGRIRGTAGRRRDVTGDVARRTTDERSGRDHSAGVGGLLKRR